MKDSETNSEPPSRKSAKPNRHWLTQQRLARLCLIALFLSVWLVFAQPGQALPATDGNSPWNSLWLVAFLIVANAFFACAEMALISLRLSWVKLMLEQKHRLAPALLKLKQEPTRFLSTVQVGVTLLGFLASAVAATSLAATFDRAMEPLEQRLGFVIPYSFSVVLITTLTALASIIFGEIIPKSIAVAYPERVALIIAAPMTFLDKLLSPLVWFVNLCTRLALRPFGVQVQHSSPIVSEEELKILVEASEEQGVIDEDEKDMIHSIFEFTDTIAREVMTPRVDMRCVDINATPMELVALVRQTGHSRIPVYEGTVDNIIGVVHVKDMLRICEGRTQFHLREVMRPVYFVPENKKVSELLEEFRRQRVHMALVQDEYGGTAGLVTLEDLVEEIVGEIQDEYDAEFISPVIEQEDGSYLVDARLHLDDVNDFLDTQLASEEFDTLGGYVFGLVGHQTQVGEVIKDESWKFTVHELEGHRIRTVRMERVSPVSEMEDDLAVGDG